MSSDILTDTVPEMRCKCGERFDVADLPPFSEIQCPTCGTTNTVPARLGGFLLLSLLGKGGMGAVYQALDESLNRQVAVKVMLSSLGEDKKFVETFREEGQAAAALSHPNIVQIYSFGEEKGQLYIVMELLTGGRLDLMMAEGQPLDQATVFKIGMDVASGLAAANEIGLVHGDIKPENILMDNNGVAKVVDFGLASFKEKTAATDGVWGTPYYIAPEKVRGQRGDARSDIYSLGATLFHALAGKPPFDGATALDVVKARLSDPAPALSTVRPNVLPAIDAVVARMLQADPLKRYPTYVSLLADMTEVFQAMGVEPKTVATPRKQSGKFIVIKGKGGAAGGSARTMTLKGAPLAVPAATIATIAKPKKKGWSRRKKMAWILIAVVALVAIVSFSVLGVSRSRAREAAETASRDQAGRIQKVMKEFSEPLSLLLPAVSNALAKAPLVEPLVATATNAAAVANALMESSEGVRKAAETLPDPDEVYDIAADAYLTVEESEPKLRKLLADIAATTNAIATSKTLGAVKRLGEDMNGLVSNATVHVQSVRRAYEEAQKNAEAATRLQTRLTEAKAGVAAEEARTAAQKAEAQKKAADEAAAQRKEKELKARVEEEIKSVNKAHEESLPSIKTHQYPEALAAIKAAAGELTTGEGKNLIEVISTRLTLLTELKALIIKQLAKERYAWGWQTGQAVDVLGADDTNVKLPGRLVPWPQVNNAQMLRFIKYAIGKADIPKKERARMWLAAAVFCYENSDQKAAVLKFAAEYVDTACELNAELKDLAAKLMPDLAASNPTS